MSHAAQESRERQESQRENPALAAIPDLSRALRADHSADRLADAKKTRYMDEGKAQVLYLRFSY